MITIVKREKKTPTYTLVGCEEFLRQMKGAYFEVNRYCSARFCGEYVKRNGCARLRSYTKMVLLRIPRLTDEEQMERVMEEVMQVPYTHLAWREKYTGTVLLVCRYDWKPENEPADEESKRQCLTNAYKHLHYLYSCQLGMRIDTEEPAPEMECACVHDGDAYYNPDSQLIYVDSRKLEVPAYRGEKETLPRTLPGMTDYETRMYLYQACVREATLEACKKAEEQEQRDGLMLNILAEKCFNSGLPMEFAISLTLCKMRFMQKEVLVRSTFEAAYADELLGDINLGVVDRNAILIMRTEAYLKAWYEMRLNVLSGVVQWRERSAYEPDFKDLTEEDMNSMTLRALKAGLGSWDKDVNRILHSNEVRRYDPLADYIGNLPTWDGKDRIGALAQRIPSDCPHLEEYLHVWLLSMVAHWMGVDQEHGNAVVPLLIGHQGCGKTTFASQLLPPQLRAYYNDKVDFRTEGDIMSALSNFALINIDEFDSLKKSQQPTLKYLLSKSEVKVRPTYGKSIVRRRRYASFIATTNLEYPLRDQTGSRRFVCIKITPVQSIDTHTPIDYEQLYAQLYAEVRERRRYWFDEVETAALQQHNAPYLYLASHAEMIDSLFVVPQDSDGEWMSVEDILSLMQQEYPYMVRSNSTGVAIGRLLREKKFPYKKTCACAMYLVKRQKRHSSIGR